MATFQDQLKKWNETTLAASLKSSGERKERFETTSGIPVERLYGPADGECPAPVAVLFDLLRDVVNRLSDFEL